MTPDEDLYEILILENIPTNIVQDIVTSAIAEKVVLEAFPRPEREDKLVKRIKTTRDKLLELLEDLVPIKSLVDPNAKLIKYLQEHEIKAIGTDQHRKTLGANIIIEDLLERTTLSKTFLNSQVRPHIINYLDGKLGEDGSKQDILTFI